MTLQPTTLRTGGTMSRRNFLRGAGGAGLSLATMGLTGSSIAAALEGSAAGSVTSAAAGPGHSNPILVMIQLEGGMDHFDAVVPTSTRYEQLRGRGALDRSGLHPVGDDFALHPSLSNLAQRWHGGELAIVHGVGLPKPTMSHFVDTVAWERASLDESERSGWLGRALNDLRGADPDPTLGLSIGELSPAMRGPRWDPAALPDDGHLPWTASFVQDNPGLVAAYTELGSVTSQGGSLRDRVRTSHTVVRQVADRVGGATDLEALARMAEQIDDDEGHAGADAYSPLHHRLDLVADLILGGLGTRAFHVRHGEFDTHADQTTMLPDQLAQLDRAVEAFRVKLGQRANDVVIATWTEFGRRPEWNGNGTEHGTAGVQFVISPRVRDGHLGEPSPLDRFDRDGNFLVTTDFRSYLGGLAQATLGVEATDVVDATPMEVLT